MDIVNDSDPASTKGLTLKFNAADGELKTK